MESERTLPIELLESKLASLQREIFKYKQCGSNYLEKIILFIKTESYAFNKVSIAKDDLKTRKREYVQSRQLTIYVLHKFFSTSMQNKPTFSQFDLSQAYLGGLFNKDHATAIHSVKTINNLIDSDKQFAERCKALINICYKHTQFLLSLNQIAEECRFSKVYANRPNCNKVCSDCPYFYSANI